MGRKRKYPPITHQLDEGSSSQVKSQYPWVRRAILRSLHTDRCLPVEGIVHFQRIIGLLQNEMFRVRRAKRRAIVSRRRYVMTDMTVSPDYDRRLHFIWSKKQRMIRKIILLQRRASEQNTAMPIVERFTLGTPSCVCSYCGASMWREESTVPTRNVEHPTFSLCCNHGDVHAPLGRDPPESLKQLMNPLHRDNHHFHKLIRAYNSAFSFTSMGGKEDNSMNNGRSPYIYSVGGQIFHRIGSLIPAEGKPPQFAQLYVHDTEHELEHRRTLGSTNIGSSSLRMHIMETLRDMFDEHNGLARAFRYARNRLDAGDVQSVKLKLLASRSSDGREYDLPSLDEFACLIVDETGDNTYQPDIVVQHLSNTMQRVSYCHPSLMALQYPILFPYGEDGWHANILLRNGDHLDKHVSQCDYYAYRIQTRIRNRSHVLMAGRLFQQYVVNAYALVEAERLDWVKNNQQKLRKHYFHGLYDAYMRGDADLARSGKHIILASTHMGSPRCKYENFQDAIAICRTIGYPDLFITFTCNAKWPEIQFMINLLTHVDKIDPNRADVMARVFKLKLYQLVSEIKTKGIFGNCIGFVHAIEFQKRGLPHAHMLVFLSAEDKIHSVSQIDAIISAEIPDKLSDPQCYEAVSNFMFHGPCGHMNSKAPCTVDNKCGKHFPKKFSPLTTIDEDGFPRYRRRDSGRTVSKNGVELDNRYIVPYNRYLLLRFDAHINVEFCNKSRAIKYLFKYINKPPDRARAAIVGNIHDINSAKSSTAAVECVDEIKAFMDCRYISAGEACWRLFKFDLYSNTPAVLRLTYHLPGQQSVYSNIHSSIEDLVESESAHTSMLLEWMKLNEHDVAARQFTFVELPQYYTWKRKEKVWAKRKKKKCIARLYYCHPSSKERFYLRMLLHTVKGCQSFKDIMTVDGVTYDSFQEACGAYGFLADDGEWNQCLNEVSTTATAKEMRKLFVRIIMHCEVSNVGSLWRNNWKFLSDDIQYIRRQELSLPDLNISPEDVQNLCLLEIEKLLHTSGKSLADFPGLPIPSADSTVHFSNRLLAQELDYDHTSLAIECEVEVRKLNVEQRAAYDKIIQSVDSNAHECFFIDGFGGTGKTFLWRVISMKLRSAKKIVLCVASSGIAALLMPGGRTAHSRFHIPIDINETSTCHIEHNSDLAELLNNTSLIIWDEAPMTHKHCMEALDRTLRDIIRKPGIDYNDLPFGGITVVFGGDFRQTLPIIPKATRTEIVNSSIKRSYLWDHMIVMKLCQNMRLHKQGCTSYEATEIASFSKWIIDIGDGVGSTLYGDSVVTAPTDILVQHKHDPVIDIVDATYNTMQENYENKSYFAERAVLAPLHETVSLINDYMLTKFNGDEVCCYSSDTIQTDGVQSNDAEAEFPAEFLNSMKIGNFPEHQLKLKVGAPVILLRNIDQSTGLCNGTRMIIKKLGTWSIEVEVVTGSHIGDRVHLPRMTLASHQKSLNFTLLRRQYPIALCFGMTINKSQGQTLNHVGICLYRQVFTHGQLYVALSRVTTKSGLKIISCAESGKSVNTMNNIVFREILS